MATVTFDVFSALTDSRTGGAVFFGELVRSRSWHRAPEEIFDRWDSHNKRLHLLNEQWAPFSELAEQALTVTYGELGLPDTVAEDCQGLLASMGQWPLWPDIGPSAFDALAEHRLGLLSNIDDGLLEESTALSLGVFETRWVWTSQRARAYKPSAAFYQRARREMGPYVHVASSARDVRGALGAGVVCVRLRRPGHGLDPNGPQPLFEADAFAELPRLLARAATLL